MPAMFQIGNTSDAEKAVELKFTEKLGGATNPEILDTLDAMKVILEAGAENGYHYQWTATEDTSVALTVDSVKPENTAFDVVVTVGETAYKLSENGVADETGKMTLRFEVVTDDQVLIQVVAAADADGEYPAAQIEISAMVGDPLGSPENPIVVALETVPGTIETVLIPVGEDAVVSYEIYGAGSTILTIENADAYVICNGATYTADENGVVTVKLSGVVGRVPVALQIGNSGEEAASFTLNFENVPGGAMTPVVLEDISEIVTKVEGDVESVVYYSWTATQTGVLRLDVMNATEGITYDFALNNITIGSYMNLSSDGVISDMGTYLQNFVNAGDEIQIVVTVNNESALAEAEVTMAGYLLGTEENPLFITETQFSIPVAGGKEVYFNGYCFEQTLTVEGESAYVLYEGARYEPVDGKIVLTFPAATGMGRPMPIAFTIGNTSEYSATYSVSVVSPVGSLDNPEVLEDPTSLDASIPEGDSDGAYYYTWTATDTGLLHVELISATEGVNYDVAVNNISTGAYMSFSADGVTGGMGTYLQNFVREGDEIQLVFSVEGTMDSNFVVTYPAADISVICSIVGTEENPLFISNTVFDVPVAAGSQIVVNAYCYEQTLIIENEDAYVIYNDTVYNPVDGKITITFPAAAGMGRPMPISFVIGNNGSYAQKFSITIVAPVGTWDNPEILESISSIEASIPEGDSDGMYYFLWEATESGVLRLQVNEATAGVSYDIAVNNANIGSYMNLGSDGVQNETGTYLLSYVNAGDEVEIVVSVEGTMDSNFVTTYPALDVSVSGYVVGTENSPIFISEETFAVPVMNGQEVYLSGYCYGYTLRIPSETAYVDYNGSRYTAVDGVVTLVFPENTNTMGRPQPITFKVGNSGMYTAKYEITVAAPLGLRENPERIEQVDLISAHIKEGNSEGYYFYWIATGNGTLTFSLSEVTENVSGEIILFNNSTYAQRSLTESGDGTVSIQVNAGDEILITLGVMPDTSGSTWIYPEADVTAQGVFAAQ